MATLPGGFSPKNAALQAGSYINPTGGVTDYDVFSEKSFAGGDRSPAGSQGVYWRGADGNVYVKGSQGTNSAGRFDSNSNNYWQQRGYSYINDPNSPSAGSTTVANGVSGGGGSYGSSQTAAERAQYDDQINYINSLLGGGIYELDVDAFRLELRDLEDSEAGIVELPTHNHNTTVTLSGVTYARTVEIINGYTVEFEDVGTPYTVKCVGANHNIGDVKVVNQVSLLIGNSAGLIQVTSGSGVTNQDKIDIISGVWSDDSDYAANEKGGELRIAKKKAKLAAANS